MRKKEALEYEAAPATTENKEITARLVNIKGEDHLLIDYWRDGRQTGRTILTERQYSTYDYQERKWTQAAGYNLKIDEHCWLGGNDHEVVEEHEKLIRKFCKISGYSVENCITSYMWRISDKKAEEKEIKTQRNMEEHFAKLEDIEEKYLNKCAEKMKFPKENAIWYKRKGMKSTYVCGCCGKQWQWNSDVSEEINWAPIPKVGEERECKYCKKQGMLVQIGRAKKIHQYKEFGHFELLKDKTVAYRHIRIHRTQYPGERESFEAKEILRVFFDRENKIYKYYGNYNNYYHEYQWNTRKEYISADAEIKEDWLSIFKRSDPLKYFEKEMVHEKILDAAMAFVKIPQFEMCYKMGLEKLCANFEYWEGNVGRCVNKRAKTMDEFLKVRKCHVKEIVESKGDKSIVSLYQEEKSMGIEWSEKEWELAKKIGVTSVVSVGELRDIGKFVSIKKAYNYIEKQKEKGQYGGLEFSIRSHYADYLNMRAALGYDMTNTVYLFPRDLEEQHGAMVKEKEIRENEKYIEEMMKKYSKIAKRAKTLNKQWSYREGKFLVRAAESAAEIVLEGRIQHHCVGGERQGYLQKHNSGKSTIFLMRRVDNPDKPYVTIELANGRIQQWYGRNDTKNIEGELNEKEVDEWLNNWLEAKARKKRIKQAAIAV